MESYKHTQHTCANFNGRLVMEYSGLNQCSCQVGYVDVHLSGKNYFNNLTSINICTDHFSVAPNISETVEVTVEEEDDLVLECDTRANPLVSSVTWSLNGSLVDLLADGLSVINNGLTSQLTSSKVKKTLHGGMYTCTVDSPMYGSSSRHFQVTITGELTRSALCNATQATSPH